MITENENYDLFLMIMMKKMIMNWCLDDDDIGDENVFDYDDNDDFHYLTMMMMYRCWWFWCRCDDDDDDDDDVYCAITLTVFIWYSSLNTSSPYGNHCHHIIHHAVLVFACMHKGFYSMDDA